MYRAEVSGTVSASPSQIVNYIEDWLTDGGFVTFDFNSSCQVELSSNADPECNDPTLAPTSESPISVAAVGGAIGSVIIVVFIGLTIIVAIVSILIHRRRTRSFYLPKNE